MKVMNGLVITLEEDKRFYVFGRSIVWAILPIREWRCQDIDQVSPTSWDHFFLSQCIQQQCQSVGQNYFHLEWTADCSLLVLGRKERKLWSQPALACFMLKVIFSVPQAPQTNHLQYSSPVEALNLIVDSKSQSAELDRSTIALHVPSRRKKSLQSYSLWILISLL